MEVSFSCPTCGPSPSVVIADGVVLAHITRLRHELLSPPTTPSSVVAHRSTSSPIFAFLPQKAMRSQLLRCADALQLAIEDQSEVLGELTKSCKEYVALHPARTVVNSWLDSLLLLVQDAYAYTKIWASIKDSYDYLFKQLAAEEGIFQLCRPFRHSPAFGLLVRGHTQHCFNDGSLPPSVRPFLSTTAAYVQLQQQTLLRQSQPFPSMSSAQEPTGSSQLPYAQTGSFYGSTKCRQRPFYSGIDTVKSRDTNASRDEGCRKYYDAYVKQRRTGGIMALWCPHMICVGFHIISEAEGRNDVFSALFTHWERAPNVVVYDFACQLAPYCLRREPEFFQDTLFVIDQMHQYGHSKCTLSSFLSAYMSIDPSLRHLSSSAAECGNSALSRIKKSVSYSGQEHAVLLIKHFLCVWNRLRIRNQR
ncbi:hypothetical protein CF319_g6452 [Tilletia indica]|nr:hypothetical protein CF319_g6452 [Tilletia indica]